MLPSVIGKSSSVCIYGLLKFCNIGDIDLGAVFFAKLESSGKKYPVDKVKGRAVKYTDL